jgi:pyridoxine 5'-phosphate synthase PdxJ
MRRSGTTRLAFGLAAALAAAPVAERVCVGRAFVARAALVGIERAVRDFRERI